MSFFVSRHKYFSGLYYDNCIILLIFFSLVPGVTQWNDLGTGGWAWVCFVSICCWFYFYFNIFWVLEQRKFGDIYIYINILALKCNLSFVVKWKKLRVIYDTWHIVALASRPRGRGYSVSRYSGLYHRFT